MVTEKITKELSESTPAAVSTSGTVGTAPTKNHSDHSHAGAAVDHDHSDNTASGGGANISVGTIFALQGEGDDTQTGTLTAWTPTSLSSLSIFQWKGVSQLTAQGITAQGSGRLIIVHNATTTQLIQFEHENASASSFNRIQCPAAQPYFLTAGASVILEYNNDQQRWRIIGTTVINAGAVAVVAVDTGATTGAGSGKAASDGHGHRLNSMSIPTVAAVAYIEYI